MFYEGDEIIVTEQFGKIEVTNENFPGAPNMIRQLRVDDMTIIRHLPIEFVIIKRYRGVGFRPVNKFFQQLLELQEQTKETKI